MFSPFSSLAPVQVSFSLLLGPWSDVLVSTAKSRTPARFDNPAPKGLAANSLPALVPGLGEPCRNGLSVRGRQLLRPEIEGHLGDFAREAERHLIIVVVHSGAGVHADVEGFVHRYEERNGARNLLVGDFLAVHLQHARAALSNARAVIGEVEHNGVLARRERLIAFPAEPLQIQHVVEEHRLALQQVQTVSAEATALGDDHPFAAAFWHFDLSGDREGPGQDTWCVSRGDAGHLTRVSELG